jgi:glycosyltransferase involved in cell wall biosynthesis
MRITVANSTTSRAGGVESYLSDVIPALKELGHEVSFLAERTPSSGREPIIRTEVIPIWCARSMGADRALNGLIAWKPDLIFTHKSEDPVWESRLQRLAPSVFFAHDYQGLCISGDKMNKFPEAKPCTRRFGPVCLLQYFPRQCGGRNPLTMLSLYTTQRRRLALLKQYTVVVTHSQRMARELRLHGIAAQRIPSYPVSMKFHSPAGNREKDGVCRLVFSSRMEFLKGGHILLQAMPSLLSLLKRPVELTMVGDGRERRNLERMAARLCKGSRQLDIVFTGWLNRDEQSELLARADLVVMSSLWPEPFGMAGLEAGLRGVPAAAFAVGGIPDWLHDGVNGALAPADPPTPEGLTDAIHRCLIDPAGYERLRMGALRTAEAFNMKDHLMYLMKIFERVVGVKTASTE